MYESAFKIFDYLPIRATQNEIEYRDHLWACTVRLYVEEIESDDISTQSFSIMPFHILFMLALQYKIFRIKKQRIREYEDRIKKYPRKKHVETQLLQANSVYEFGLINEKHLPSILNIIGLTDENIFRIQELVSHRNNSVAHAKGGYIFDVNEKIDEYLSCLFEVQKCMEVLNNEVASDWLIEIEKEEDLEDFKERKLASSYICNEDFRSGDMRLLVSNSSTPFIEWFNTTENNHVDI